MPSPPARQEVEELKAVETKGEIRRELLKKRSSLDEEERERLSRSICLRIASLPEYKRAQSILFFYPVKGEPDIRALLTQAIKEGRALLPKVEGEDLSLHRVGSLSDLSPGAYGIPEPLVKDQVEPSSIDLLLVPGVGFDLEGFRLGWGKGYYDRLLKRAGGTKLGIAFSFQVLDRLPRDHWDVPVDAVVTEKDVIRR